MHEWRTHWGRPRVIYCHSRLPWAKDTQLFLFRRPHGSQRWHLCRFWLCPWKAEVYWNVSELVIDLAKRGQKRDHEGVHSLYSLIEYFKCHLSVSTNEIIYIYIELEIIRSLSFYPVPPPVFAGPAHISLSLFLFFHFNFAKAPAYHLCCRYPLEKIPAKTSTWATWGSLLLSTVASLWALGSEGRRASSSVSAQDFSDHSCFQAWVYTWFRFYGLWANPQAGGKSRIPSSSPYPSPSRCSFKIHCSTHVLNTDVSVQTETRNRAFGIVAMGQELPVSGFIGHPVTHLYSILRIPYCTSPLPISDF